MQINTTVIVEFLFFASTLIPASNKHKKKLTNKNIEILIFTLLSLFVFVCLCFFVAMNEKKPNDSRETGRTFNWNMKTNHSRKCINVIEFKESKKKKHRSRSHTHSFGSSMVCSVFKERASELSNIGWSLINQNT